MSKVTLIARVLLGLLFFVFGLNGFLNFIPMPPLEPPMSTYFEGMMVTKYFFPLLKGTEVICGLLLIVGAFVPLALVVLAPIVLNIFLVHAFMAPEGLPMAIVLGALMIYLSFFSHPYSDIVKQIFRCPKLEGKRKG